METIRGKALRAFLTGAEIAVDWRFCEKPKTVCGKVTSVELYEHGQVFVIGEFWHGEIAYSKILDIRFVDEEKEADDNPCLYHGCELRSLCRQVRKCSDFRLEKAPPDVAKGRWRRIGNEIKGTCGTTLAVGINSTNEELDKMAAASGMLDVLEELAHKYSVAGMVVDVVSAEKVKAVIKKARGGESDGMDKT